MNYSIIIPFYNEEENVSLVNNELINNLKKIEKGDRKFEIIYVDDGSSDKTFDKLKELNSNPYKTLLIRHRINLSQSAALNTGIHNSQHDNLIILDGDLQDNPEELEKMIIEYERGCDMIIGWRKNRKDNFFMKTLPSLIANYLVRLFSKSKVNDHGCAFKIVKKNTIADLTNWGDFHRLLAARLANNGYNIKEIEVKHNKRLYGKSKYGFGRILKVLVDLIYLNFLKNYKRQSVYFFGQFGIFSFILAFMIFFAMIVMRLYYDTSFIDTPLPILSVFFLITGLLFIFMGILAQLIIVQQNNSKKDNDNSDQKILFDK